jgi:hypothetical protein
MALKRRAQLMADVGQEGVLGLIGESRVGQRLAQIVGAPDHLLLQRRLLRAPFGVGAPLPGDVAQHQHHGRLAADRDQTAARLCNQGTSVQGCPGELHPHLAAGFASARGAAVNLGQGPVFGGKQPVPMHTIQGIGAVGAKQGQGSGIGVADAILAQHKNGVRADL